MKSEIFSDTDNDLDTRNCIKVINFALKRYGFLGTVGRYILLMDTINKFLSKDCLNSKHEIVSRKRLLEQFKLIDKNISCAHSPAQFVIIADYIFGLNIKGPIVECGCFKGGSTAKLSLIAQATGRELYVCDSFSGLPKPKKKSELILFGHNNTSNYEFQPGEYFGSLQEVKKNIKQYGFVDVCRFVPGLFNKSLGKLKIQPAVVVIDVDLISSAKDCLKELWPKTKPGGIWFTHEANFINYIDNIMNKNWWHKTLEECPPLVIGAGSGLSMVSEGTAYFKKNEKEK